MIIMIVPEGRSYNRSEVYNYEEAADIIGVSMPTLKSAIHEKRLHQIRGQRVEVPDGEVRRKAYLLKIAIDPLKGKQKLNGATLFQAYMDADVIKIPESEMNTNESEKSEFTLDDFVRILHQSKMQDAFGTARAFAQAYKGELEISISGGLASAV